MPIFIIIDMGNVFLDEHFSYKFIIMTFVSLILYFPRNYILMFSYSYYKIYKNVDKMIWNMNYIKFWNQLSIALVVICTSTVGSAA